MRRSVSLALSVPPALALLTVLAGGAASVPGTTASSTPSADLAATGSVAGGVRTVESFHPVVFVFRLHNNGPATVDSSADLNYTTVRNGDVVDQLCVFPNGNGFDADSPYCEFGTLAPGQTARMTLIVQPHTDVTGVPLSVRVCASNESEIPDRVPGNNCVTKRVHIA
jgi:hypothetical protein